MKALLLFFSVVISGYSFAQNTSSFIPEVGITIGQTPNSTFIIQKVESGSSAEKAGLKKNDMITNIKKELNAQPVEAAEKSIDEVVGLLKGPKGSQAVIQYLRHPDKNMKTATVTRQGVVTKK